MAIEFDQKLFRPPTGINRSIYYINFTLGFIDASLATSSSYSSVAIFYILQRTKVVSLGIQRIRAPFFFPIFGP